MPAFSSRHGGRESGACVGSGIHGSGIHGSGIHACPGASPSLAPGKVLTTMATVKVVSRVSYNYKDMSSVPLVSL